MKISNPSIHLLWIAIFALTLVRCAPSSPDTLPVLGNKTIVDNDTIYHTIRNFEFIDQDSQIIDNKTFEDKIYVVDFFFISCPTICPKVKKQMLRIHERFGEENDLKLLSHSIDTRNDTIPRLKAYSKKLNINNDQWKLVTGNKDSIMVIAEDYFSIAKEDPNAPGGFDHSGRLILVDTKGRVRSFCDGTDPDDVDRFMEDIDWLLHHKNQ